MQKLPYKGFEYVRISLQEILNTGDGTDNGCFIVCDNECTDECKLEQEVILRCHSKMMSWGI